MSRHFGGVSNKSNRNQKTLALAVGVFFLLLVVVLALLFVKRSESSQPQFVASQEDINMVNVVVPLRQIQKGEKLLPDMFQVAARSRFDVQDGVVKNSNQVIGHFAKTLLLPNQPLYRDHLSKYQPSSIVEIKVPPGYRAVSITVDATSSIEGWAKPGSVVDVHWITKVNGTNRLIVLVKKAEVISAQSNAANLNAGPVTTIPTTVTLKVKKEDSKKISLAASNGKLQLVLVNKEDEDQSVDKAITLQDLYGERRPQPKPVTPATPRCTGKIQFDGEDYCMLPSGEIMPMKDL